VASLTELKNTIYDAGAGNDTLDLSALNTGVTLRLSSATQGNKVLPHSTLWADGAFHGSWWTWDAFAPAGLKTIDSVLNFEKVVGTQGNDSIQLPIGGYIDGGAGDDSISASSTLVGGAGSDQLVGGTNTLMIGGTFDGIHATPDNTPDEFFAVGGTILDFELGTDHLYIDNESLPLTTSWIDVTTSYGPAAQLQTVYGTTINLVGLTAAVMNSIPEGFGVQNNTPGGVLTSGPGDDFIYDHSIDVPQTYVFGTGSGHDLLDALDINYDTLVFPDAPTASSATYHGDPSTLLTFDGGNSSVLLIGITMADLSHIAMQYPAAAQHQVMNDYAILF